MGAQSVSTVVSGLSARSVVGVQSASTAVSALSARSAVGSQSANTVVSALIARSAVGLLSASTVVSALGARSAVVHQSASTVVYALGARSVAPRINESRDECPSSSSPAPSLTSRGTSPGTPHQSVITKDASLSEGRRRETTTTALFEVLRCYEVIWF